MIKTSLLGKIAKALLCISLGASIALGISGCGGNKPKSAQQIANETGKPVTVHRHLRPSKTYYPEGYDEWTWWLKKYNESHPDSSQLYGSPSQTNNNQQSQYYGNSGTRSYGNGGYSPSRKDQSVYYNDKVFSGSGREKKEEEYVNGYFKTNGKYVDSYYRTTKDDTKSNNYSYIGNVNPHTGKKGYNY